MIKKVIVFLLFFIFISNSYEYKKTIGLAFAEIAIIPAIDYYIHTKDINNILNFDFIVLETEPYIEDKIFHVIAGKSITELNNIILKEPVSSAILSIGLLTLLELRAYFSWRDELSNIVGVALYYLNMPIKIRAGLKNNNDFVKIIKDYCNGKQLYNMYHLTETEIIYPKHGYYIGCAVSTTEDKKTKYGLRFGKELTNNNFISKYFITTSLKFTVWL